MALNATQKKLAAKKFIEEWSGHGDEKQDTQKYWNKLLTSILGVEDNDNFVDYEYRLKMKNTNFIDAMVHATHTLIEQKSYGIDLNKPIKQSDNSFLKPFEQAKRYAANMPYTDRPRWIVVCNFSEFQIFDMQRPNDEPEYIELKNLAEDYPRLNFIVDTGSSRIKKEDKVSKDAGALVSRIYNALLPCYGDHPTERDYQDLNKFIVRLVFCFYAEDAGIFGKQNMFHDYMASFNAPHFRSGLIELFKVLDQKPEERDRFMEPELAAFPYVNGSLFTEDVAIPPISEDVRSLILDYGCAFDWRGISPTIFGAIFESTLNPDTRRHGGMHYTSIENIHKVIDPLFLNTYKEKFQEAMQERIIAKRKQRLLDLQDELASEKFLDPACGSGNFLTESYLSLRRLENDILRELYVDKSGTGVLDFGSDGTSDSEYIKVSIQQFYGIEINDFAVAVAKTAMWIAEYQMFEETESIVSRRMDFLPLTTNANIREGNALQIDWKDVLPPSDQVKALGNPPFLGYVYQSKEQKEDLRKLISAKNMDYVGGWYIKAAKYIKGTNIKCAFVSTNSITQGEQVSILWKYLVDNFNIHIDFAYRTFKWTNEADNQAAVHVVIIGFSSGIKQGNSMLITGASVHIAHNISPYLVDAPTIFIEKRTTPLCTVPKMHRGSQPTDDGNFIFSKDEYQKFIKKNKGAEILFRPYMMGKDFINRQTRYCLWLKNADLSMVKKFPEIINRIEAVKKYRLKSPKEATRKKAETPMLFDEDHQPNAQFIALPSVSSERRRYIPIGFMNSTTIVGNKLYVIEDVSLLHFGILISNVHMAWMRIVAGRLKSDYNYSNTIVYNNFPWPVMTETQQRAIEETAQAILNARAIYPNYSFADLYDELTMPIELREAHRANDRAVMKAYGFSLKMTESECVAELMKMYQMLVENENNNKK